MHLAIGNLLKARSRFLATVVGIGIAVFLMLFQSSLLVGFMRAAGALVRETGADILIAPRGVPCFDFPAPLRADTADVALGLPDVESTSRVVVGFTTWQRPDGLRRTVTVVGAEPGVGSRFPLPMVDPASAAIDTEAATIDAGTASDLGLTGLPAQVVVGSTRATIRRFVTDHGTFLGAPYVFSRYEDATRFLHTEPGQTSFVAVRLRPGADRKTSLAVLARRFSDFDVHDADAFATDSGIYWMIQTGAGGAIGLGAILGFVVGAIVMSQTIYATTMENIEEYATLRAIGASTRFTLSVVLAQAAICGACGTAVGMMIALPLIRLARAFVVSWIYTPPWLLLVVTAASITMSLIASIIPARTALTVDPGRVFRA